MEAASGMENLPHITPDGLPHYNPDHPLAGCSGDVGLSCFAIEALPRTAARWSTF